MIDVTITQIILHPFKYTRFVRSFHTMDEANNFIKRYVNGLEDVYGIDLYHRYDLAVKRFKKGQLSVPYFYSHPVKGVLVRNVIEVKNYVY